MGTPRKWFISDDKMCACCQRQYVRGDRPRNWFAQSICCSPTCASAFRKGKSNVKRIIPFQPKACARCRRLIPMPDILVREMRWRYRRQRYCSKACRYDYGTRTVGVGYVAKDGYIRTLQQIGRSPYEHRVIVEKAIGRRLTGAESVHHINGDKQDNRNENLLVCSNDYHKWLHNEMSRRYAQEHFGSHYEPDLAMLGC